MKKRNQIPCDEAKLINAAGDRPIDHLDSRSLDRHLEHIYLFKLGLQNSFGIDFRSHTHWQNHPPDRSKAVLFNYLSEITSLLKPRVKRLPKVRQEAYAKLEDAALVSFWEVYYRFQPLIHRYAQRFGVEVDDLGNVLGRAILLYEKQRGFKFYSYLEKTLRESIKNLRGKVLADQYGLPLSAGRLLPQLLWLLDQETLRRQRRLTADECDQLVISHLRQGPAQFSELTMRTVAAVVRTQTRMVSLDRDKGKEPVTHRQSGSLPEWPLATEDDNPVDAQDEYEHALRKIQAAIARARLSQYEQAIVLERLNLAHDKDLYARLKSELSAGSLRNRKNRLLVRFMAAFHAGDAPRFGRFLHADPLASRSILQNALGELADSYELTAQAVIQRLLNLMSLTGTVYKLSIAERGRLSQFLLGGERGSQKSPVDGHLYNKLKAALMEQERLGFPCLRSG
ncbi:MAG: hypothetical protein MI861_05665 [Pirellulales bacterium]|nr:hypothetical protein [Pirellulales bacterium]